MANNINVEMSIKSHSENKVVKCKINILLFISVYWPSVLIYLYYMFETWV